MYAYVEEIWKTKSHPAKRGRNTGRIEIEIKDEEGEKRPTRDIEFRWREFFKRMEEGARPTCQRSLRGNTRWRRVNGIIEPRTPSTTTWF